MQTQAEAGVTEVDLLIAGLGPAGCAAALAAHAQGLRTLAVEARGIAATRSRLVLVRPRARAALRQLGLPDLTEGRRTTTIQQIETRLRSALIETAAEDGPLSLHWHTGVTALECSQDQVRATLQDEAGGPPRTVTARHLIDATGGRLEAMGRPARVRTGASHLVITAEYLTPPWFEGIVGVSDRRTHETYMLFPTWGRRGVIAYFDSAPGDGSDAATLEQHFQAMAQQLGLGTPTQPVAAVNVYQRGLQRPSADRVVAIGDAVGTVDVLLAAGMSMAIEDGIEAVRHIAAAQRSAAAADEMALTRAASARIFARHRTGMRWGRLVLAARPLLERAWPQAPLPAATRETLGPPPLLWPAIRFVFGRRPQQAG
jgi:2-polyprenyl-6-methoxyphenol hydroxylase-like FAD-dependent oxidoreductase